MGRAKTAQDPSIESLLDSIRRAIHDGSAAPEEPAAARAQPASSPAKAGVGDSPLPGRARPAPLRPVQAQAPGGPTQSAESGSGKAPRPVPTRPAQQPQGVTGSMREMRVSLAPAPSGPGALSARTDDFLALRNRLANLSVTRDRLSRTLSSQDNGFAGILGGDVRLEEALARAGGPKVAEHMPAYDSFRDNAPALRDEAMHPASSLDDLVYAQLPPNGSQFAAGYDNDPATYDPLGGAYDEPVPVAEEQHYGYGAPDLADGGPTGDYLDHAQEPTRAWLPAHPAYPAKHAADHSAMLSADASVATASAFNRLADTIVAQATAGNRSVEDITREVLRPMLKSWLDEHLPRVVERLVREEIERVARRGGR
jgi:cell pole-organizing protein PopZ